MINLVMHLQKQNAFFEERLAASNAARFGRKTETLEDLGQLSLFNEAEAAADEKAAEPVLTGKTSGKKQKGKQQQDLSKLPRTVVPHELSDAELKEVFGTNKWTRLADEVYCKVEYHPAWQEVLEHHVAVYAGKKKDSNERAVVRGEYSVELIEKSIATPSLVAAVMNAKYVNAMPLYRIEQEFQRQDLNISRQNMANWVILSTDRCLVKMYDLLHKKLCGERVIQGDETTVKVVKDGRSAGSNSYMHVFRTGAFQTARDMKCLLQEILHQRHTLEAAGNTAFTDEELAAYSSRYDAIVQAGIAGNPLPAQESGKRGRPKRGKIRALLDRLQGKKDQILRFAWDWTVPFSNNEAERSIRFSKVKQKVSGYFRTLSGAEDYASIMSFISTASKHGVNYFDAVKTALNGDALQLVGQWA